MVPFSIIFVGEFCVTIYKIAINTEFPSAISQLGTSTSVPVTASSLAASLWRIRSPALQPTFQSKPEKTPKRKRGPKAP